MKLRARLTNLGIEISLGGDDDEPRLLEPSKDADQENPRRNYVYAHLDTAGQFFYIGKGTGRRAWSTERHVLWHRYVAKHLKGLYNVRILQDNLSEEEAEQLESDWIAQCSESLVNWINMGRATDSDALERHNKLRDANRRLIKQAKDIEKVELRQAVDMYIQAIEAAKDYAPCNFEKGLVGMLIDEEAAEFGLNGEIEALDRLTLCLIKLGRWSEAAERTTSYFASYKRDLNFCAAERIAKRIAKATERAKGQRSSPAG
ncbi:MAG: hypothetical protein M1453_01265 [Acidobacteria bacterium]|nr:hypothetical protein [Acidobacteriota bacterium]